jgi:subtilisin family serine protease
MNTYLIDFKNDADKEAIQAYINNTQFSQIKIFNRLEKTYQVSSETRPVLTDIVSTIVNDDESHLQLLTTVNVPMPATPSTKSFSSSDDHNWWKVYSIANADLDQSTIDTEIFGEGVNIYMVDSGIDITHSEFADQDINLLFSFTNEFSDNNGHGTGLSSLIVGNTCGLTNATLNVVKILDQNIPTKQSDLLSALNAILEDAAVSSNRVSVVNLSWSIPKNVFIESKIQCLIDAGMIVVVSAGNSGMPISDVTPASMPDVFTIGSYGQDFIPSNFSNFTSSLSNTPNLTNYGSLDSWAPGENIYVASPGNNGYSVASGTSISSAIYSGAIAYNMSQYLTSTGDLPLLFQRNAAISSTDRKNIMDLSDSKYSSSVNKICSYVDIDSRYADFSSIERPIKQVARIGQFSARRFLVPKLIKSYEILGELPNGVTIDGININFNMQDEPVSENHVGSYSFKIRLDLRNLDMSITKEVKITLFGTLFDPITLSKDDPLLELTLDYIPCTNTDCTGQPCGCPSPNVLLLMGDMTSKPAGQVQIGDFVYTMHETTKEFGKFIVTDVEIEDQPMVNIFFTDDTTLSVSRSHKFLMASGHWQQVFEIGEGSVIKGFEVDKTIKSIVELGLAPAVKLTVKDAHTYISEGLISHNIKFSGNYGSCGPYKFGSGCPCL